jgi:predicted DNA-binding ArsR family transcriptional regulator
MKLFANITNEAMAKLFSLDFLVVVVAVTLSYAAVANKVSSLENQREQDNTAIAVLSDDVAKVKTDVEVIKRSQEDYQKYQKEVQQNQTQELRDIKAALAEISRESRAYRNQGD